MNFESKDLIAFTDLNFSVNEPKRFLFFCFWSYQDFYLFPRDSKFHDDLKTSFENLK